VILQDADFLTRSSVMMDLAPSAERFLDATEKRPHLQSGRWHLARLLAAGFALACVATHAPRAQTNPASPSAANSAERPWVIVTLDSEPGLPYIAALDSALRKALTEPGRHPVDIFGESLDAIRFPQAQIEDETVALLAKKYATKHIDAVVTVGAAALDFAEEHRSRLWPDARILFQSVPVEKLGNRPLSPTTTGIPVQYDFAGTVELARALRPSTRRLVVIYGSGDVDRIAGDIARKQLERFSQRPDTEYWTDASIDQLLRRIGQLDANDAVLYLSITRDADGRTFIPRDAVEWLAAVSPAPIYAPFETYIGHGTVAGSVFSYEARGRRMAEVVQEALSAPTASIPLVTMTSSCMADASQLKRFGMAESSLPPGCDVRFRAPSLWRDYRGYIVGGIAAVVLQSIFITALLLERRARRRTATVLDEKQHQLSLAAGAVALSAWIWDTAHGRSPRVARHHRKNPASQSPLDFRDVIASAHPADRDNLERTVSEAVASGEEFDVEYRVTGADGEVRWIAARGRAEKDDPDRLIGVAFDVTERKAAEMRAAQDRAALRHMTRVSMVGQLSAAISHQLNQPLAAILGNAEAAEKILARSDVDLAELREICRDIVNENHRASEIIRRLGELYKRGDMKVEAIDLNALIRETLELLRTELLIRHVVPITQLASELPLVDGGHVQLQQVVLNLVLNAADALNGIALDARRLIIRTEATDSAVRLYVADNGSGIAAKEVNDVFSPFWSTKPSGMGIGLAICQSIVTAHRGRISAANNAEGGATFCVSLPVRVDV
jgi:C4-dicarboxylate-specific signal transduction histidine kinase